MRLQAKGTQRTAVALVVVAALSGFGIGYYNYRQGQTAEKIRSVRARRAAVQARMREAQTRETAGDERLAAFLSPESEQQAFTAVVRLVESFAEQCDVQLAEIKPLRPVIGEGATKQLSSVTLEGKYAQVIEFLRLLEDNRSDAELYRLGLWAEALSLSMPSDREETVVAKIEIARLKAKARDSEEEEKPATRVGRVRSVSARPAGSK